LRIESITIIGISDNFIINKKYKGKTSDTATYDRQYAYQP
jgi:hypothetical protein